MGKPRKQGAAAFIGLGGLARTADGFFVLVKNLPPVCQSMPVTLSRSVALWNSSAVARRPKLIGHQRKEAIARREAGETLRDLPGPTLLVAFNMTS